MICENCRAAFSTAGGILDFVAGRDDTKLDILAYDQVKQVTSERSRDFFQLLSSTCGELLPKGCGRIVEIGAGTGLLTIGMLALREFDCAVISDISPRMLAICRARVAASIDPAKYSRTLFMTYGGTEDVFPEGVFDLCVGNSVVHHILDYRGFFTRVRKALTPEGRALFVEPSAPFHNAVTLAISDLMVGMLADRTAAYWETDLHKLASWVAAVRTSLNFRDVDRSAWEDKHFFSREDFAYAARSAGFSNWTVLPWALDPLGLTTLSGYLHEIGVTQEFMTMFFPKYQRFAQVYFQALADQDQCSMYIVSLYGCESGALPLNAT